MEIRRILEADWPTLDPTVTHAAALGEFAASSHPTGSFFVKSLGRERTRERWARPVPDR
ncbi:MAG TPA: hypothetical protein VFW20_10635 [Candidatus Limnocylindrales bacterium]|nr:hypothetical protein [Candidatus Limnocylindrales bacterium]